MIKFEIIGDGVYGWQEAIRGMRNSWNSWDKSDSGMAYVPDVDVPWGGSISRSASKQEFCIGPNDFALMKKLVTAGPDHRKFLRMITVYVDITAPLYWWKEFDTYKVGTVANSCSTMHTIAERPFAWGDFSNEHLTSGWIGKDKSGTNVILPGPVECLENTIVMLNRLRDTYLEVCKKSDSSKDMPLAKDVWWQMIQLLPSSYNQKRTVMMNYEVLANIYESRKGHKLDEWRAFCSWIEELPYSDLITGGNKNG